MGTRAHLPAAQLDRAYVSTRPGKALQRVLAAAFFEGRPLTARARWLNPLVFAGQAVARALPCLRAVQAPLFLIGTGRSGTTWLGKVLSLHPTLGFLNEPKALWHAAIPDEDLIGSYTRAPARLRLEAADATPRARRALTHGYGSFLWLTRARRVLDKYPELVFRVDCVRALFPDARFLFLQRSGHDTCRSVARWSAQHARTEAGEPHDWWGVARRKYTLLVAEGAAREPDLAPARAALLGLEGPEDMAALEWILAMRAGLAASARHPTQILRLRYENLVHQPRAVLAELLEFAGLEPDERLLAYAERSAELQPAGPPLALAEPLRAPFADTQQRLGYAPD